VAEIKEGKGSARKRKLGFEEGKGRSREDDHTTDWDRMRKGHDNGNQGHRDWDRLLDDARKVLQSLRMD
jgi:hypothetical protein